MTPAKTIIPSQAPFRGSRLDPSSGGGGTIQPTIPGGFKESCRPGSPPVNDIGTLSVGRHSPGEFSELLVAKPKGDWKIHTETGPGWGVHLVGGSGQFLPPPGAHSRWALCECVFVKEQLRAPRLRPSGRVLFLAFLHLVGLGFCEAVFALTGQRRPLCNPNLRGSHEGLEQSASQSSTSWVSHKPMKLVFLGLSAGFPTERF